MAFTLDIGQKAPPFHLAGVDGRMWSLDDFAGFPLLVVSFSCNHCPYVVGNEGREREFVEKYGARGVGYVAINANDAVAYPTDGLLAMKERAARLGFKWPYLRDETQEVAAACGAVKTPHFFVFDGERALRYVGRMDDSPRDAAGATTHELADAVEELLAGQSVRTPITEAIGCTVKWKGKDKKFIPGERCDVGW
ncbi:MAG TPA: thioredoxin family protein [Phycisphaerae bacterium]|nr:thioredoxin family protein [Phycisphaerae bacterium]